MKHLSKFNLISKVLFAKIRNPFFRLLKLAVLLFLLFLLSTSLLTSSIQADLNTDVTFIGREIMNTYSVAWGDWDGDGDLDLAVGNLGGAIQVYENEARMIKPIPVWTSPDTHKTRSVAWGDWDGDGDLDLAVGYSDERNQVYENRDGTLQQKTDPNNPANNIGWLAMEAYHTYSVAWGDWDDDGDLDLAVGNFGEPNQVYENRDGTLQIKIDPNNSANNIGWQPIEAYRTTSVAWGDWNNDGDLDLAVGNSVWANLVYENTGKTLLLTPTWLSTNDPLQYKDTRSIAWGDCDSNGYLDLAVGNSQGEANQVYKNVNGMLQPTPWESLDSPKTTSVAWGDWDNDGDLDLAVGNSQSENQVFQNVDSKCNLNFDPPNGIGWEPESNIQSTTSVAWGDIDNDGDLDLAVGNDGSVNQLYQNEGRNLLRGLPSITSGNTTSTAWGDWNGDGYLDLAVGKSKDLSQVYQFAKETQNFSLAWQSSDNSLDTQSVAWGDFDNDRSLDLAIGNKNGKNQVYQNKNGTLQLKIDPNNFANNIGWQAEEISNTTSIAWGDWNGDGYLDLAVGNDGQANLIYENQGGMLAQTPVWRSSVAKGTTSIAWGDIDNDGDLDLAVGNRNDVNQVYENIRNILEFDPNRPIHPVGWQSDDIKETQSVAWGDFDGDRDLDLAVGNIGNINQVFENQGGKLNPTPIWVSIGDKKNTNSVAWGDFDGDGDLDLAVGNEGKDSQIQVYENDKGILKSIPSWEVTGDTTNTRSIAWGDFDGDGDLDIVVGRFNEATQVYENLMPSTTHLPNNSPSAIINRPFTQNAFFYSASKRLEISDTLPIDYTLFGPKGSRAGRVQGYYSLNGGGQWFSATATSGTQTVNLKADPAGNKSDYIWNTFAPNTGFFGQSDNVVFRLDITGALGPFQRAKTTVYSPPFRLRGTQVRVISDTLTIVKSGVPYAIVYRLPQSQPRDAEPIDSVINPFRTDNQGYLQGHGQLHVDDNLIALLPITNTESYTLYYTSAPITAMPGEPLLHRVDYAGVQTLTVSANNPLLLFNLNVALEWDASNDEQYMSRLKSDLRRVSEILYDWTDGQAALGHLNIYQDAKRFSSMDNWQPWRDAHIRIYATNRLRPNAAQGGTVPISVTEPVTITLTDPSVTITRLVTYTHGQVHIGAVWNRYGDVAGNLGEDWPRALAHELGHYLFYLNDNYLGVDKQSGVLITLSTNDCSGAMNNPYSEAYSEFEPNTQWGSTCEQTLSHQSTGRSDWATIKKFYPQLKTPDESSIGMNLGPNNLLLAVTQIQVVTSTAIAGPIEAPIFNLSQQGSIYRPGSSARAFLFQGDQLIDLGNPILDQVIARGARAGDRLCVFELAKKLSGCTAINNNNDQLAMQLVDDWQPEIIISPVTSRTVNLTVTVSTSGNLNARLFPVDTTAQPTISLQLVSTANGIQTYKGTLSVSEMDELLLAGYIHVWMDVTCNSNMPCREAITSFGLGGSPGRISVTGKFRAAPTISTDGQVTLYGERLESLREGEFYMLQAATALPEPLPWAKLVGNGYWLKASKSEIETNLENQISGKVTTSIAFQYLGEEVPPGEEEFLRIYFWGKDSKGKTTWQPLPTKLNDFYNVASAATQGAGFYALMSSVEIPLAPRGWNLISYPIHQTRTVTLALQSIDCCYQTVYGYNAFETDLFKRWEVYGKEVPTWVNTLHDLKFGRGYWITVTQVVTLWIKGVDAAQVNIQSPPATYYGTVRAGSSFAPEVGLPVVALVGNTICGKGETRQEDNEVVYVVTVYADGPGEVMGCGTLSRTVRFIVGDWFMSPEVPWDNNKIREQPLIPDVQLDKLYLPLISR